ncbi:ROK family transcriptional regulator [Streptomyces roseus]|uniref:ROK family transcriptional regulator n=1 Tax=Streptomyces roseus TaxID=66430 RepID=UPI000B08B267|nr:ROK family transcriptional regulator [Streptomyces roseus]
MDWRSGSHGSGANLPALRGHNDALVLALLREAGFEGLGRTELAALTRLTPQAVSKITGRLRAEGLVADAGRGASTGGKPRTLLQLAAGARHAVGVHADRDELRAVRVDMLGTVVERFHGPLDFAAGPDAVADEVARAVDRLCGNAGAGSLLGVGVAAPGPLDWRAGVLGRVTGYPEWEGFPLRQAVADRLGPDAPPVLLDKDTNAGVAVPGRRAAGNSLYLHLGTGLGAGLRLRGEVFRGERSAAGEFGHQVLMLDGPPCRCGGRGCAEVLCLGAVARGDLREAARILGEGAANVVALLDVDRVWLGGRVVGSAPEVFTTGVRRVLEARTLGGPVPEVAASEDGVAEGAAELALAPLFGRVG